MLLHIRIRSCNWFFGNSTSQMHYTRPSGRRRRISTVSLALPQTIPTGHHHILSPELLRFLWKQSFSNENIRQQHRNKAIRSKITPISPPWFYGRLRMVFSLCRRKSNRNDDQLTSTFSRNTIQLEQWHQFDHESLNHEKISRREQKNNKRKLHLDQHRRTVTR